MTQNLLLDLGWQAQQMKFLLLLLDLCELDEVVFW